MKKLVFKGFYKNEEQLPKGILPSNAVKFKEVSPLGEIDATIVLLFVSTLIFISLVLIGSTAIHGSFNMRVSLGGVWLFFIALLPHELLHYLAFGEGSVVELYIAPKHLALFVTSTTPMTKKRFIYISLLPNIVLGLIPCLAWMLLPYNEMYSDILITFSVMMLLAGIYDYYNAFNALHQMPRGSMHQLSGSSSYWFMPEKDPLESRDDNSI